MLRNQHFDLLTEWVRSEMPLHKVICWTRGTRSGCGIVLCISDQHYIYKLLWGNFFFVYAQIGNAGEPCAVFVSFLSVFYGQPLCWLPLRLRSSLCSVHVCYLFWIFTFVSFIYNLHSKAIHFNNTNSNNIIIITRKRNRHRETEKVREPVNRIVCTQPHFYTRGACAAHVCECECTHSNADNK